nr:uroporphyrinogen-III synthase [Sphingobium subterraneum]
MLILRPQPGADATAARARQRGLETLVCPLFRVAPLDWTPPDPAQFDAVMLTSANAARHAGPDLHNFTHLPCFTVGRATAAGAREAGFTDIHTGEADIAALIPTVAHSGRQRILHFQGRDVRPYDSGSLTITSVPVYESREDIDAPALSRALAEQPVILLHSPRAAACLAGLVPATQRSACTLVAISPATLAAAGTGWGRSGTAPAPSDAAMLAIALQMCQ